MKILLSMPKSLVTRVDKYCESEGFTRSEFIRGLIRDNIEKKNKKKTKKNISYDVPLEVIPDGSSHATNIREGFCELHFEQGKKYDLREAVYEDVNGNEVWNKWICEKCIKRIQESNEGNLILK